MLRHRTVVFLVTGVLLAGAILAWPLLPVELAPQTDADEIDVDLEMAQGTNIAVVNEYLHELEKIVREAAPMEDVKHVSIEIRNGDAEVELSLREAGERTMDSLAIADHSARDDRRQAFPAPRSACTAQSGLWMLRRLFGSGGGSAVQIELRGYDLALADRVAQDLKTVMEQIPEIADVNISRREGRPEQNLRIDREKIANLGLTVREVAETIQANVGGVRAGVFREGGDEFPIVVRLQPEDRLTTLDLGSASVRTPDGQVLPVSAIVDVDRRRSPTTIERIDGQRVTYITANLASRRGPGRRDQRPAGPPARASPCRPTSRCCSAASSRSSRRPSATSCCRSSWPSC